jgi:nucleoside phosphorylase/predicted phosphodiesterase
VRLAALQSLVKQGGPQEVLKLARLADDEAVDVEERAEALASALQICARLTPDSLTLRLLSRSTLDALRTPSGLLAMSAAMHAHVLGDQIAERLLEVCRDEQASDSVREEACRSLARQLGQMKMPRNGDHTLREQAADILLELVRREPATVADEEEPNLDPRQRLAQAAAAALTEINAERLLGEPGTTCANALAAFAVRTGCLVFPDRIINASGQTIASLSQPSLLPEQSSNTETDSADQASREALRRVRRWSRIAADDAQQVIQAAGTEHEVLLGPELYVQRDIEQEIYARLEKSERGGQPVNILVTGEAGHGKTSLLWRLHQTLGEAGKWEPWFIKSTLLALAPRAGEAGGLHLDDLLAAARLARIEGRRPLVLLDTVDALLHGEEAERERVVEALLTLSEEGCGLIAACRPQEAMLLGPLRRGSLRLDEYKGRELTEAIDKHVAHFYAYADLRTREEHRAHINSVVARGLPLREVCVNPLTLRMLFVLYAPDPVPAEVNVFDLYDKFWRDRVVTDRRAGSPLPQPNAANLEKAASLVALVMLAEGQPELPAQQVRDGVVRCGGNAAEVAQLVSRGVLHGQDGATLHFFHQTFFEHSAARAILDHFGENGLSLLQRRLADRPHDMFLSPVYEQALLLAETSPAVVRRRADDLLGGLFRAGSAIERSSAAYIYAHRKNVPPTVARQFQELLKTADTALVRRFLTVAPNLPIQRWEDLFHELDLIWERGKWEERAHTLDLLERLAVRDDRRVLGYLTRHEVFDYILKLPFHFQGATRLLRIYAALAVRQPARSWELVSRFYGFGIQEQSQDLQISAINALAEYAALYGPENIARRFEEMARNTAGTPPRFNEVFPQAIGRLWTIEWRARNVPVETVIEAVNDPQADEVQTRARLYGLAGLVVDSDNVADAAQLFESFRREADVHRQWLWARMCLPGLLGAEVEDDDLLPAVRHARREIIAIFRDRIRQAKSAAEALPDAQRIFLMAREAVEKANFSPARLAALLDFAEAEAPGGWLDRGLFAELLPDACVGGHGGAAEAMRLLANAPEQFPEAPVVPIALRLSMLAAEHREAVWQFLALTARVGSAEGAAAMVRTLELLQPPAAEIIDNLKASLNAFRQMLITSRSVPTQRTGFALWWHLVRLGVCDPPSLDEIRRQLEQKSDVTTRAELVNLLAQAAVKNRLAAQEVAALLLPLAALKDQKLGKAALTALVNLIIELPVEAPEFILKALDVALAAPTDSGRPTLFGRVIEFLSARNVALATEILKRILRAPAIAELGKQAQKDIANRLRSPARQLVRVMTQRQRNQMLALTPAIAPLLQRVIVEAVCHEAFLPSIVALDQLLASEGLADHTVELIRRQKYARERSAGGETWLELYDLVRQGVDSHSVANLKIGLEHPAVNDDFEGDHLSDKELTFIHLSDIHFHPDEHGGFIGVDDDIRHQLINDVESWCHGRESITAILVTGDIAYSGSAKQYVTAERWLKEICQRAGCDPKNVWMVPGNHDVNRQIADRSKSLQDCHRNLRQINPDVNPGAIDDHLKGYLTDEDFKNTFLKPLNDYISFASKYGCQIGAEKVYWEKDVQLNDGSTLRLRGMTTALISDKYDDNKNNKLVLGRHQAVCRDEKGVVYMTLAHHPPAWLLDEDEVDDYLKARASIHLFGHKHRQRVEKAERYIRLSAGATNPEENQLNWKPCYNFISITVLKEKAERKMRVRVYTRIWDEQHKVFLPQSQPDGQQFVEWVKRLDSWEPPAPTPVIDASEQINSDWLALLRRIAEGERFLRPVNESEDELKSFASQANGLLELRRLGYLDFSDRAVVKESQTGHSYVTIVGPCRITYQGEQLTKVIGKSDHGQTQTTAVAKPRLGIVIALGEEFAELFREIEGSFISDRDPDTGRNYYFFERASSATGKTYRNVATFVGGMGPTQAALVSQAMMIRYAPQTMVMLGIAGGIDGDVCIGDIIIPTVVDAYLENSKAEKSASGAGFDFILGSKPFRPSTGWIRLVEHLPFAHKAIFDLWQEECADDWLALIPDATTREELLSKACVREKAGLVTGHLASGPTVGATEKFSEWLKTHRDRKYLGLEMEAAGLMAAANEYLHAKDTLVVRAVSDFGDERKKEMEQKSKGVLRRYAVRNAIRLLWLLVEANDTINQRQK